MFEGFRWITQKDLARTQGYGSTKYIRDITNSLRQKGYWVISGPWGMCKTSSRSVADRMAGSLLSRANSIVAAAEGLMRKDREELTEEEEIFWESLPENNEDESEFRTTLDFITEDELRHLIRFKEYTPETFAALMDAIEVREHEG